MSHAKTRYNTDWLSSKDRNGDVFSDYIVKVDDYHAKCKVNDIKRMRGQMHDAVLPD